MKDSMVLLSKDILMKSYLPAYGNKYWKTPNIDELAKNGTVFNRHYASAPSTSMSLTSMFTGMYPYQFNRKRYESVEKVKSEDTFFGKLEMEGFENHIVWGSDYYDETVQYTNCYGDEEKTVFHNLDFGQNVGPHFRGNKLIQRDENLANKTVDNLKNVINNIVNRNRKIFLWIHLPHVLLGREAYGSDIDLLDNIVGFLREKFGDESIFITADHGNMNGKNGIYAYGFDVYEPAINIPLIAPKLESISFVNHPTSNTQLEEIIIKRSIPKVEYVVSDTTYYAQPNRKTAIIKENYKYIYNKKSKTEQLYDLEFDPEENINLLQNDFKDPDRKVTYHQFEVSYYPFSQNIKTIHNEMTQIKESFWRDGTIGDEVFFRIRRILSIVYNNLKAIFKGL